MIEADVAVDAELLRGVAQVLQDVSPVGDRFGTLPGPEGIAEREHVRVRADARVAKQIPGAARRRSAFQNGVALALAFGLQSIGGADAGQAGANDQDIKMLWGLHGVGLLVALK